jgi:hypothetical protein
MFTTLSEGLEFIARLFKGFMIGFAIATGVSLLILPITSRGNVFHDIKELLTSVEDVLQAQISFADAGTVIGLLNGKGSAAPGTDCDGYSAFARQNRSAVQAETTPDLHEKARRTA